VGFFDHGNETWVSHKKKEIPLDRLATSTTSEEILLLKIWKQLLDNLKMK
jgi:hypothetical protein